MHVIIIYFLNMSFYEGTFLNVHFKIFLPFKNK